MSSLSTNAGNLATRISTEIKSLRTLINGNLANLSALTTTAKTSLVAAINELNTKVNSAASINDAAQVTTSVWSGSKTATEIAALKTQLTNGAGAALDTFKELADAMGNDPTFATTITTSLGTKAAASDLAALTNAIGDTNSDLVQIFNTGLV